MYGCGIVFLKMEHFTTRFCFCKSRQGLFDNYPFLVEIRFDSIPYLDFPGLRARNSKYL